MSLRNAKIDRSFPIRQGAANLLQQAILKGQFHPGDELSQLTLSKELGLSQTSVREALQELETRGLVVKDGRNWMVTKLDRDDLSDLYYVRAVLEPIACRIAAYNWREEDTVKQETCLRRMEESAEAHDYIRHSEADMDFHRCIWRMQPNRVLEKHLNLLCMPLFAHDLIQKTGCNSLSLNRSIQQHRMMVNVLCTRDGERAERIVRRLIMRFQRQDLIDFQQSDRVSENEI